MRIGVLRGQLQANKAQVIILATNPNSRELTPPLFKDRKNNLAFEIVGYKKMQNIFIG
jgi:hypothetical protein